jgi:hypothetical protein
MARRRVPQVAVVENKFLLVYLAFARRLGGLLLCWIGHCHSKLVH